MLKRRNEGSSKRENRKRQLRVGRNEGWLLLQKKNRKRRKEMNKRRMEAAQEKQRIERRKVKQRGCQREEKLNKETTRDEAKEG